MYLDSEVASSEENDLEADDSEDPYRVEKQKPEEMEKGTKDVCTAFYPFKLMLFQDWMHSETGKKEEFVELLKDPYATPFIMSMDGIRMYR